jgi:predicted lipoprotein
MKCLHRILRVGAILLGAIALPAQAFDHEGLAQRALQRHIVPGYERLAASAASQSAAIGAVCEAPSDQRLTTARSAFKDALLAWGRIEHIRFGPIAEQNRLDAMIFWPDPRGIARRQIARVLTQQDADALSPQVLAGKSVAIQGFSALDVVLFGPGSDTIARPEAPGRFRCGYARALAANIETIARAVLAGWTGPASFAGLWLNPAAGNAAFLSAKETTHTIVQAYLTGLKQTRNVRLGGPLGLKGPGARSLEPVMPNSSLAFELIIANVEGLRALLIESGLSDAVTEGAQARSVMQSVATELELAIPRLRQIAGQDPNPFQDSAARSQVIALGFPLKNAHDATVAAMSEAAGLSIGFNSLDGD